MRRKSRRSEDDNATEDSQDGAHCPEGTIVATTGFVFPDEASLPFQHVKLGPLCFLGKGGPCPWGPFAPTGHCSDLLPLDE